MTSAGKRRAWPLVIGALTILFSLVIAFVLPGLVFPQQPLLSKTEYAALFPFKSRYITLENGARIHYVDEGSGPTLLFFHGNPTSAYLYRHLIKDLRSDYRVIAFDYPGFGKSTAPDQYGYTAQEQADTALAFFDAMKLKAATFMVQDWGGPIGFYVAQSRLDQVEGMIIGNTWAWPLSGNFRYETFSWAMGGFLGEAVNRSHIGVIHIFLKRGIIKTMPKNDYAGYFQNFIYGDRKPVTKFPRELIHAKEFLARVEGNMKSLEELRSLIVWGEKDFAFRSDFRRRFESYFPNHNTILLPDAGHFIQEDAPNEIASGIRSVF